LFLSHISEQDGGRGLRVGEGKRRKSGEKECKNERLKEKVSL
jgi:hypothetical protein